MRVGEKTPQWELLTIDDVIERCCVVAANRAGIQCGILFIACVLLDNIDIDIALDDAIDGELALLWYEPANPAYDGE
ncbi:unnamed protein product [Cylicocyclus nassatus]|uniref:Uncharacterized protein n=1 Tax=Cylicocyclus nassatus TaxID=53992 RepID=A0AA36M627_CYLNA|nr:unnamed protein product [Cylicocyclus nassatus]